MSIAAEILRDARHILAAIDTPDIAAVHLPEAAGGDCYRDEFGFVFLDDGSAAPFYVSLPGTLEPLRAHLADPANASIDLSSCLQGWQSTGPAERALALGAWNALGQHLLRRAGFRFAPRGGDGPAEPRPGEPVGMVGYFCPVIDRLVAAGNEVLVIEQQPGRVPPRERVSLSTDPGALAGCRLVYCTASTLINDTLDDILAHCRGAEAVALIGPSGSGLPDVPFAHGVTSVGGVHFADVARLRAALAARDNWGPAGEKYEIAAAAYPGIDALLDAAARQG